MRTIKPAPSIMKPEQWQQVEELYHAALERVPDARAAFLAEACANDADLRREVEELLRYDGEAETFMQNHAAVAIAQQLDSEELQMTQTLLTGQQLGVYKILSALGKGGMGEVFLALDTRLERKVALKLLPRDVAGDKDRLRRFVREAKAASALNHPHVATVYDIGAVDGVSFIAMEYVEGQTLAAKINGAPLSMNELVAIGSQIADALDEAHSKGITHRDLKPANVMLTAREQVKVLDFGLAKMARPTSIDSNVSTLKQTTPGVVMGTVPYMSPEQALGRDVDHRSDIFSLGVVLYEMATGRLPFAGANTVETLDRILHAEPETIAQFNSDAPATLEGIVRKCLAKERAQRYQSAGELLVDLQRLQRDSAPVSQSVTATVRPPATASRYARPALALLLVISISLTYFVLRPSPQPKINDSTILVRNGRMKAFNLETSLLTTLATDSTRLYFAELVDFKHKLAQVSITGGEVVSIPTPFSGTVIQDIAPNKTELLVASREAGEPEMPLWVLPILGGSPRRLGNVLAHGATYSPDGTEIIYANGAALYRMKSDGVESRQLVTAPGRTYWPRWSPDGSRVRFTVLPNDSTKLTLWEVAADGTNAHPILTDWNNEGVCCGSWTADGKFYVFQASHNRTPNIWALREPGGLFQRGSREPMQLTVGPINYRAPVVSQDGRKLFVIGEQKRGELVRYDARTQQFVNFLEGISAEPVSFSPDGAWIAYVTYPEGTLWRSRVDGSERLQLSTAPRVAIHPSWSPDGKKILFNARPSPGRASKLYLVSSNGGSIEELLPGARYESDPTWSPDGSTVVFDTRIGIGVQYSIQLLRLDTRQTTQLPDSTNLYSPRWSPVEQYIAALHVETQVLMLYDFTTQQWRALTKTSAAYPCWSRDGKHIYYFAKAQIFRVRISDGKIEPVANMTGLRRASGIAGSWMGLTPDDAPMLLRDVGTQDIYALDWQLP